MGQLRSESSASETEGLERDPKRQKVQPTDAPNDFTPTGSICSFCQSSKTSEVIFACTNPTHCFSIPFSPHAAYAYGQMDETISWSLW